MPSIKGMHDIRTHGSLSCQGELLSVAKNLHKIGFGFSIGSASRKINRSIDMGAWDGSVARHSFNKVLNKSRSLNLASFYQGEKIMEGQIRTLEDEIKEMTNFVKEGLPGAKKELERLCNKLLQIKAMGKTL